MLLGDLISRFGDETAAHEALLGIGDLALLSELRARAKADASDLGAYAARAVARFTSEASDEDWATLIGAMNRARDPGAAFLRRALAFRDRPESDTVRS